LAAGFSEPAAFFFSGIANAVSSNSNILPGPITMNTAHRYVLLVGLMLLASLAVAQVTPLVSRVTSPAANENQPLSLSAELTRGTGISKIVVRYRSFGESEFKELEMLLAGRIATVTIPFDAVRPPSIDYYIEARMEDGSIESHPVQNPETNPARITVKAVDPKDQEVRVLSPEPGETAPVEELGVVISLFYAGDNVNREATKVFLDGVDITGNVIFADDLLLYSPRNVGRPLNLGAHILRVELYDTQGRLYHRVESSFNVSTAAAIAAEAARFQALLDGQAEFRNEQIGSLGSSTNYVRGDLRLNGSYGFFNFGATTHLDNQEDPKRQPQNRYLLHGNAGPVRLQIGDAYPRFPSYLVSGKRVRGVSANLALGFFNLDVSFGETNRLVEGVALYDTTFTDSSAAVARPQNSVRKQGLTYTVFQKGTWTRDLFVIRPSFGKGENFQLGFTYLKAKDEVGSIRYGVLPEENLVVGTDLLLAFDDQKVKFESQASVGITNKDISGGSFGKADFDSLRVKDPKAADDLEAISKIAENFITVNENLFPTNPMGSGLPGVSYEAVLSLNYFDNFLRASVFQRGAAYRSFGNDFLQTDIRGFQISDRIRMFNNKAFLSLSYESREDNTADNKTTTTTFDFFNSSLTILPGTGYPTFTLGFGLNNQANDIVGAPLFKVDNKTTLLFLGMGYDFVAGARHNLNVNVSSTDRTDATVYKRDQQNLNIQAFVNSTISPMLQTSVGYVLSNNTTNIPTIVNDTVRAVTATEINYSTVTAGAQLRLMEEMLRFIVTVSPTFGDFNRTIARAGLDIYASRQHTFELVFDYIQNSGMKDDTIGSVIYRFNF
jgi:hypothetical protein